MGRLCLKPVFHGFQNGGKVSNVYLPMVFIEDLNESAHMGAFEFLGKVHIHVDTGHRLLATVRSIQHGNGIADVLDPHLVDIDVPVIPGILDVAESLVSRFGRQPELLWNISAFKHNSLASCSHRFCGLAGCPVWPRWIFAQKGSTVLSAYRSSFVVNRYPG